MADYICPRCNRTTRNPEEVEARRCRHCGRYEAEMLCFRIYIAGDLISEEWVSLGDDVAGLAAHQAAVTNRAEAAGLDWLLEVYDPERNRTACLARRPDRLLDPSPARFDETLADVLAWKLGYLSPES